MQSRGEFLLPRGKTEKEWARHSYVQLRTLQDVHKLVEELTDRLKKLNIVVQTHQSTQKKDQTLILKVCVWICFCFQNCMISKFFFSFSFMNSNQKGSLFGSPHMHFS